MFTIVNGILLTPLPVVDEDRIVFLKKEGAHDQSLRSFPVADLVALRERGGAFENVAGVQYGGPYPYVARMGDQALSLMTTAVSDNFFRVLGVGPVVGRIFDPVDAAPGADRVAVISHGMWQGRFGGDPEVVGRILEFENPTRIVGVAPRGFEYPNGVEVWTAFRLTPQVVETRSYAPFNVIGRLRLGTTVEQAQREAAVFVQEREALDPPGEAHGQRAVVLPFRNAIVGDARRTILILFAAVMLLLVMTCANVANLLLIRGAAREREVALRAALGASRGRIARQLLLESALLAAVGGLFGVMVAYWAVRGFTAVAPPDLPQVAAIRVDARVLAFALGIATMSTFAFGLVPTLWAARAQLGTVLRNGSRGGQEGPGMRLAKQALVVWQIALALVVLVGAGLLTKSLLKLQRVDMGFSASQLTLVRVGVPFGKYPDPGRYIRFFEDLVTRVEAMPGIVAATPVVLTPFSGPGGWNADYTAEGQGRAAASENPTLNLEGVSPGYFRAMGIPIRRGRAITDDDRSGAVLTAIISESLARRAWPGQDPLGKRIKLDGPDSDKPWLTVVGTVGEVRYRELATPPPSVYVPFQQWATGPGSLPKYLAIRSAASADAILRGVRTALDEVDPAVPVVEADPFPQLLAVQLAIPRLNSLVLSGFAAVALVLAVIGLYGVMASYVAQRTHEIGVRLALGAQPEHVRRLVWGRGMLLTLAGVVAGLCAAIVATRALGSVLYDVRPTDPTTLFYVALLLIGCAALACYFPVRRAMKVDPLVALRAD